VLTGPAKSCGAKLDCGAAWIHGSRDNPLNELLQRVNNHGNSSSNNNNNNTGDAKILVPVSGSNPWMHSEDVPVRVLLDNGIDLDESKRQKLASVWNEIAPELAKFSDKTIIEAFGEYVKSPGCTLADSVVSELLSFLHLVEVWSGGSVKTLSSSFLAVESDKSYKDSLYGDYEGPHSLFAKGAIGLVDAMVQSCGVDYTDRILLNQIVTEVTRDELSGSVLVRTSDGRMFRCSHLCVTVPPGPLKKIKFSPPLPEAKVEAINRVKMGSYKKIQLEFADEDVFWAENYAKIPLIITRNFAVDPFEFYLSRANDESQVEGTLSVSDIGPYLLWDNYLSMKGYPILEAICPAELGWKLVGKSDDEIVDVAMEVLRMHFPSAPDPSGCLITRWEEDFYSQGAYSYHTIDSLETDAQVVYENINNQIFFAGEHTDPVFYGSLNAAFHSGVRVLNELGFCMIDQNHTLSMYSSSENIFFQILQFLPKTLTRTNDDDDDLAKCLAIKPVDPLSVLFTTSAELNLPSSLSKLISTDSQRTNANKYSGFSHPHGFLSINENISNSTKSLRACLVPSFVDSNL